MRRRFSSTIGRVPLIATGRILYKRFSFKIKCLKYGSATLLGYNLYNLLAEHNDRNRNFPKHGTRWVFKNFKTNTIVFIFCVKFVIEID